MCASCQNPPSSPASAARLSVTASISSTADHGLRIHPPRIATGNGSHRSLSPPMSRSAGSPPPPIAGQSRVRCERHDRQRTVRKAVRCHVFRASLLLHLRQNDLMGARGRMERRPPGRIGWCTAAGHRRGPQDRLASLRSVRDVHRRPPIVLALGVGATTAIFSSSTRWCSRLFRSTNTIGSSLSASGSRQGRRRIRRIRTQSVPRRRKTTSTGRASSASSRRSPRSRWGC